MDSLSHEYWMQKALELAIQGKSRTQPNPMVGCLVVLDNKIIGEGYHREYGGNHAEVEAFKVLGDFSDLKNATAYVSLEPCSHHGNTPPCAEFLAQSGIGRVVTAMEDPNEKVKGRGHSLLVKNGTEVITGVLEEEAREMNRIFRHLQSSPLPYITIKWAQSKDGFIDPDEKAAKGRGSIKISSKESSEIVSTLRSHHNAILVGKNTAKVDSPLLTSREEKGVDPIRIVIDPECELTSNHFDIVVCNSTATNKTDAQHCATLDQGLRPTLLNLREMGIYSILVEGGAHTLEKFISSDLWNEAYVFESPNNLTNGLKAPAINTTGFDSSKVGPDTLFHLIR